MQLRPYQSQSIADVASRYTADHRGVLLVMPTGAGKTVVFTRLAQETGRILIVVPRIELVAQTRDKLWRYGVRHGVIAAGSRDVDAGARVQVAMAQTLVRRILILEFDLIILDECHLAASDTYRKILARLGNARILAVTATPFRLDGQGFGHFASALVCGPSVTDLTALGSLVPAITYSVPTVDLSNLTRSKGEFDAGAFETSITGDVVAHYQRLAKGRQAIVFAASVKHADKLRVEFVAAGIAAATVTGETPSHDRAILLQLLHNGTLQVICNYGVLTEGFDCPPVSCIVIARATTSCALWIQMAGRGLRPSGGKVNCILLDHGGNACRHGGIEYEREYSLQGVKVKAPNEGTLAKVCTLCAAVMPVTAKVCPVCGCPVAVEPRPEPKRRAGELQAIAAGTAPVKLPSWRALTRDAVQRGQDLAIRGKHA